MASEDSLVLTLPKAEIQLVVEAIKKELYHDICLTKEKLDKYAKDNSQYSYVPCRCLGTWCDMPFSHGIRVDGKSLSQLEQNNVYS